jgi:hypothetical protein
VNEERRGHIKLARKFFESDSWWNAPRVYSDAEAWIWCVQKACYRAYTYSPGLEFIELDRGQFVASLRYLAGRWQWSVGRVRRWLKVAEKQSRLRALRETHYGTVYLVVNYDLYQSTPSRTDTAADTQSDKQAAQYRHSTGTREKQLSSKAVKNTPSWVAEFGALWQESRSGKPPYGRIGKAVAELIAAHGRRQVRAAWVGYLADRKGKPYATAEDFAQNYGIYRDKHAQVSNDTGDGWVPIPDEPEAAA